MAWTVGDWWSTGSGGVFRGGDPFSPVVGDEISIATEGYWMGTIGPTWTHRAYLVPGVEYTGLNIPRGTVRLVVVGEAGDVAQYIELSLSDVE